MLLCRQTFVKGAQCSTDWRAIFTGIMFRSYSYPLTNIHKDGIAREILLHKVHIQALSGAQHTQSRNVGRLLTSELEEATAATFSLKCWIFLERLRKEKESLCEYSGSVNWLPGTSILIPTSQRHLGYRSAVFCVFVFLFILFYQSVSVFSSSLSLSYLFIILFLPYFRPLLVFLPPPPYTDIEQVQKSGRRKES